MLINVVKLGDRVVVFSLFRAGISGCLELGIHLDLNFTKGNLIYCYVHTVSPCNVPKEQVALKLRYRL